MLAAWQAAARHVGGRAIDCGHYIAEERSADLLAEIDAFFKETDTVATHRIAVIAGDGIGTEVMPEGVRVLEAVASQFGIGLELDRFDFACWPW